MRVSPQPVVAGSPFHIATWATHVPSGETSTPPRRPGPRQLAQGPVPQVVESTATGHPLGAPPGEEEANVLTSCPAPGSRPPPSRSPERTRRRLGVRAGDDDRGVGEGWGLAGETLGWAGGPPWLRSPPPTKLRAVRREDGAVRRRQRPLPARRDVHHVGVAPGRPGASQRAPRDVAAPVGAHLLRLRAGRAGSIDHVPPGRGPAGRRTAPETRSAWKNGCTDPWRPQPGQAGSGGYGRGGRRRAARRRRGGGRGGSGAGSGHGARLPARQAGGGATTLGRPDHRDAQAPRARASPARPRTRPPPRRGRPGDRAPSARTPPGASGIVVLLVGARPGIYPLCLAFRATRPRWDRPPPLAATRTHPRGRLRPVGSRSRPRRPCLGPAPSASGHRPPPGRSRARRSGGCRRRGLAIIATVGGAL